MVICYSLSVFKARNNIMSACKQISHLESDNALLHKFNFIPKNQETGSLAEEQKLFYSLSYLKSETAY